MSEKQINGSLSRKEDDSMYPSPEQPDVRKSSKGFVSAEQKMRAKEQKRQQQAERKKAKQKEKARLSRFAVFKLRKFEIDEGKLVRYIGHARCVNIPECVTVIGDGALSYDYKHRKKLKKVIMHAGIKKFERRIFADDYRLKKIIFKGTKAQWKKIDKFEGRSYENNWDYGMHKCIVYCIDGIICIH